VLAIILYLPIILLFSSPIFLVTFIYIVTFGGFSFYSLIHSFVIQRVFSKYDR
jgi:hypothetical protein